MVRKEDLQSLVAFLSEDPLVLSLYLSVDTAQQTKDKYRLKLRHLFKQVSGACEERDILAIERFLDHEYDGMSRSLVFFSCQDRDLWQVFPLAVPVEDRIMAAHRPFITPLQEILDEYARYGVIFVDKEGARLFLFDIGELQEVAGTLGDELKRHKQGGWAAQRLQRRADEIAAHNFREAAVAARQFCKTHRCSRIILAGTDENIAIFRGMLPRSMQGQIIGEMPMDMTASEVDVREKAVGIIRERIKDEETALVEQMVTAAAKAGAGVTGLADTLSALQQDRVHTLVVSEGYEAQGFRCPHCGYLGEQVLETCPYCSAPVRIHEHVIDAAVRTAIEKGVDVKIVADDEQLVAAGNIGAILRY